MSADHYSWGDAGLGLSITSMAFDRAPRFNQSSRSQWQQHSRCPALLRHQQHRAALGALMTAQPRHIKLGLGGNEHNWTYASYELDQLRETFNDVAENPAEI
jgi:hypothetical protein